MIDLEKLSKSHEELFPNATLESQVWKLEEELKELDEAVNNLDGEQEMKETADVLIVCGGLCRWCPTVANAIADYLWISEEVEAEVNRKWQVNLKRKWAWNGKTYKHVKGTGE